MGSGMNWGKRQQESRQRRYGTEEAAPKGASTPLPEHGNWRRKAVKKRPTMTSEERRRWAEALEKVYGPPPK